MLLPTSPNNYVIYLTASGATITFGVVASNAIIATAMGVAMLIFITIGFVF